MKEEAISILRAYIRIQFKWKATTRIRKTNIKYRFWTITKIIWKYKTRKSYRRKENWAHTIYR